MARLTARRATLSALLPLSLCWTPAAHAQDSAAARTAPANVQTQTDVPGDHLVAGVLPRDTFQLPPQPLDLTLPPRQFRIPDDNTPVIGPRALPATPDNGWSIGPIVIREDPTPDAGCRWSFSSNKIRFRCRR